MVITETRRTTEVFILSFLSIIQAIGNSIITAPFSLFFGLAVGGIIAYAFRLPKTDSGFAFVTIMLVLSPLIGVTTFLIGINGDGILLNRFLIGLFLVLTVTYIVRHKRKKKKQLSSHVSNQIKSI